MKIIKANRKNLKDIGKLMKEELSKSPFNEKDSMENVLKSLNFYYKKGEIYFADEDNEITGIVIFQLEHWWEGSVIIIQDLVVKEKFRNQNIEKYLMSFIERYAVTKNVKIIYFETNKKSSSIKFYKKLGNKINKDRLSMS